MSIAIALLALLAVAGSGSSKKSGSPSYGSPSYVDKNGVTWTFSKAGPMWTGTSSAPYTYGKGVTKIMTFNGASRNEVISWIDRFTKVEKPA